MTRMGITEYASSGNPAELFKMLGLDADAVVKKISRILL